jgi:hydroxyethylthiazole kinase-like uncharacterized protein yjeF
MPASVESPNWAASDARPWIRIPGARDDKYSHGALGVFTGSAAYPGAAVLSVEAAARTGLGLIRYFGPVEPTRLVLERRPEVVTVVGRVDAYLIGSGVDPAELALDGSRNEAIMDALVSGLPVVLDAGALGFVTRSTGPTIITPHQRELARLLSEHSETVSAEEVISEPGRWAEHAAEKFGVTVILKGAHTHICRAASGAHEGFHARIESPTTWMATAGTGDVLAGITAALVATHAQALDENPRVLAHLAATAAFVHAEAGYAASRGGPIVALDVAEAAPGVIAALIAGRA